MERLIMSQLLYRDYSLDEIQQIVSECGVKTVFSQNAKMKRSSQNGIHLYNWGIPAFRSQNGTVTCPNAGICAKGCYALQGAYVWTNVNAAYENRLSLSRTKGFPQVIVHHIDRLVKKHKTGLIMIRIHDSGDFYSESYYETWNSIAKAFQHENRVRFYAYTKMVQMLKSKSDTRMSNFEIIYSMGGKQDQLIQIETDRHSKVFQDETELIKQGYIDASHNDMLALTPNKKIGLIYHGTKSYSNTLWNRVDQNGTKAKV